MNKATVFGIVFWVAAVASGQAQLPEGFEFVQITDDPEMDDWFRINNCGQIVFSKEVGGPFNGLEVLLYDNGSFTQLTDNDVADRLAEINDLRVIVWQEETELNPEHDLPLMKYERGQVTQFGEGRSPRINNLGHVALLRLNNQGCGGSDANIFLYDGDAVVQLTENAMSSQLGGINDQDELVWTQYDFCLNTWDSEIMLYTDGEIVQLTVDSFQAQTPRINNLGHVVWPVNGYPDQDFIEIWSNGELSFFTDLGKGPTINDLGDIAFNSWDDDLGVGYAWVYQQATDTFFQLTDGELIAGAQDINDWGEVPIYMNFGYPHTDVGFLRRIRTGDSVSEEGEFDGDVDVDDFNAFESCFTGPGRVDRLCDCRFLDIDHDGDVDCDDFVLFTEAWTDPINSVPFLAECDSPCEGDTNGDGTVDPLDTGFVLSRFGCEVGAGDANCDAADANTDGVVNPLDTGFIVARFGECP